MECFLLPHTPFVISGFVSGSIMLKDILLEAEARVSFIFRSATDVADNLISTSREALAPVLCGFNQEHHGEEVFFIRNLCCFAFLVKPLSLPLSLKLYLNTDW